VRTLLSFAYEGNEDYDGDGCNQPCRTRNNCRLEDPTEILILIRFHCVSRYPSAFACDVLRLLAGMPTRSITFQPPDLPFHRLRA